MNVSMIMQMEKLTKKVLIKIVLIDYLALSSLVGILNMQNLQNAGISYPISLFIERFLKKISQSNRDDLYPCPISLFIP